MSAFCLKVEEKASVNSPISRLHTISAALLSLACLRAAAVEIYANGDIEAAQGRHRRFDFDHRTRTNLVRFLKGKVGEKILSAQSFYLTLTKRSFNRQF